MATVKAYITMPLATYEAMQAHCQETGQKRDILINHLLTNHLQKKGKTQ